MPTTTSAPSAAADRLELDDAADPSADLTPEHRSRRSFVFFGALAAASMLPKTARAQAGPRKRKPVPPPAATDIAATQPSESVATFPEWTNNLNRLVRRVTYGATPAEVARANQLGFQGYLNEQLNYTRINDSASEAFVASKWPLLSQSADTLFNADDNQVRNSLQESSIYRAAFSKRQLYQRMVEFWSDHFNQQYDKVGSLLAVDQRDVIRANAMGKFPTLLKASAHSPSMMLYLDQSASLRGAPNQNYAREIMELHTLGVDGGYTQDDVAELSRVLTGWGYTGKGSAFTFDSTRHDVGNKTVLGISIQGQTGAAGVNEGEQMLDVLVNHPSTARFIATKMLKWLLDPNPSELQISTVATVYKATGGDIKAMIRAILNDSWLPAAPMKFARPFHFVAASLRSASPTITAMTALNGQLNTNLGQALFTWATPDGYPDKIEYWAGNIVPRWGYGSFLTTVQANFTISTAPYLAGSSAAAIDLLDQNFFGGEMPLVTRNALLTYFGSAALTDAKAREAIALAISANAFQWY